MKLIVSRLTAAAPLVFCCLLGCGKSGPEIVGAVTLDGQPLPEARIQFTPSSDTTLSGTSITTDANGKFAIAPDEDTGATLEPGDYKVSISKKKVREGAKVPPELEGDLEQLELIGLLQETVPARYSSHERSELKAEIKPEPNALNFDLKSR
jgi:hypothetical protein